MTNEVEEEEGSLFHVAVPVPVPVGGGEVEREVGGGEVEEEVAPPVLPVVTGVVAGAVVTALSSVRPGTPVVAEEDGALGDMSGVPGGEDVHGVVVTVGSGS
ncbi:hypothetical protein [Streptomyces sp. TUS-ST3]|uniref:hypothetical protein n=1 Tax=Streptomyces sp. TUS-ST3 TaxID=3025591 RepID=UPI0024E06DA0|nr:hypothetical protein [Streptomyces sp. TUS-ST3]